MEISRGNGKRWLIQFFNPFNSLYFGVQFNNCTWFVFQVRQPDEAL